MKKIFATICMLMACAWAFGCGWEAEFNDEMDDFETLTYILHDTGTFTTWNSAPARFTVASDSVVFDEKDGEESLEAAVTLRNSAGMPLKTFKMTLYFVHNNPMALQSNSPDCDWWWYSSADDVYDYLMDEETFGGSVTIEAKGFRIDIPHFYL